MLSAWQNARHRVNAPGFLIELNVITVFSIFQWLLVTVRNPFRDLFLPKKPYTLPPPGPMQAPATPVRTVSWTDPTFPRSCLFAPSPQSACSPLHLQAEPLFFVTDLVLAYGTYLVLEHLFDPMHVSPGRYGLALG